MLFKNCAEIFNILEVHFTCSNFSCLCFCCFKLLLKWTRPLHHRSPKIKNWVKFGHENHCDNKNETKISRNSCEPSKSISNVPVYVRARHYYYVFGTLMLSNQSKIMLGIYKAAIRDSWVEGNPKKIKHFQGWICLVVLIEKTTGQPLKIFTRANQGAGICKDLSKFVRIIHLQLLDLSKAFSYQNSWWFRVNFGYEPGLSEPLVEGIGVLSEFLSKFVVLLLTFQFLGQIKITLLNK